MVFKNYDLRAGEREPAAFESVRRTANGFLEKAQLLKEPGVFCFLETDTRTGRGG